MSHQINTHWRRTEYDAAAFFVLSTRDTPLFEVIATKTEISR